MELALVSTESRSLAKAAPADTRRWPSRWALYGKTDVTQNSTSHNYLAFGLAAFASLAVLGTAIVAALAMTMMWATHQSHERAACYRTSTDIKACATPSAIERVIARYVADVEL